MRQGVKPRIQGKSKRSAWRNTEAGVRARGPVMRRGHGRTRRARCGELTTEAEGERLPGDCRPSGGVGPRGQTKRGRWTSAGSGSAPCPVRNAVLRPSGQKPEAAATQGGHSTPYKNALQPPASSGTARPRRAGPGRGRQTPANTGAALSRPQRDARTAATTRAGGSNAEAVPHNGCDGVVHGAGAKLTHQHKS
jgi:hypothetical protein